MAEAKKFTRNEIAKRNTKTDAVFVIDNLVYDVTKFLDDHPGGHEVLLNVVGKDATESFEDVGHSIDAKELMVKYQIGELVEEDKVEVKKKNVQWDETSADVSTDGGGFLSSWKLPVILGVLMTVLYTYLFG